jgi:hypothetical protein
MWFALSRASIRWTNERSGAATGFENGSPTGGMRRDYTSWRWTIKVKPPKFDYTST